MRGRENPDFCKAGSSRNPTRENFPLTHERGRGRRSFYDPATGKFTLIDTLLQPRIISSSQTTTFRMLYFSGGSAVMPWINVKMFDQTGGMKRPRRAGVPTVLDTNGDGEITKPWNEPLGGVEGWTRREGGGGGRMGIHPKLDTRVLFGTVPYGVIASPLSMGRRGAASTDFFPGLPLSAFTPGGNPPALVHGPSSTTLPDGARVSAPAVIDVDRNGVIWTALFGSSHLASFDRLEVHSVQRPGGTVDGLQCPQGWTLYPDSRSDSERHRRSAPTITITTGSINSIRWASARISRL